MASLNGASNTGFQLIMPPQTAAASMEALLAAGAAETAERNNPKRHDYIKELGAGRMGDVGLCDRRDRLYSLTRLERENGAVGTSKQKRRDLIEKRREAVILQAPAPAPAAPASTR